MILLEQPILSRRAAADVLVIHHVSVLRLFLAQAICGVSLLCTEVERT